MGQFWCGPSASTEWYEEEVLDLFTELINRSPTCQRDIKRKSLLIMAETSAVFKSDRERLRFTRGLRRMVQGELLDALDRFGAHARLVRLEATDEELTFRLFLDRVYYTRWKSALVAVTSFEASLHARAGSEGGGTV